MMIIPIFFLNLITFTALSSIGDGFDLFLTVLFGLGTGILIRSMIHSQKTVPPVFRLIGWILILIGLVGWSTDFKDFSNFCFGMGFVTGGFWSIHFARKKNTTPKRVSSAKPVPVPSSRKTVWKPSKSGTTALLREVSSLESVKGKPQFRETLDHTNGLYQDLKDKGVHVSGVLTDQTDKLLETYLDLDDDPVQTKKTQEMKGQIENSFTTIDQALENLHDRHTESRQMELETDIQVMEMKLRMEGLLDSDFSTDEK